MHDVFYLLPLCFWIEQSHFLHILWPSLSPASQPSYYYCVCWEACCSELRSATAALTRTVHLFWITPVYPLSNLAFYCTWLLDPFDVSASMSGWMYSTSAELLGDASSVPKKQSFDVICKRGSRASYLRTENIGNFYDLFVHCSDLSVKETSTKLFVNQIEENEGGGRDLSWYWVVTTAAKVIALNTEWWQRQQTELVFILGGWYI